MSGRVHDAARASCIIHVPFASCRDEDRAILMDLKAKGASRRTFSALSEKLKKPSGQVSPCSHVITDSAAEAYSDPCVFILFQVAHRFYQLMKLYKKQGKVDT